MVQQETFLRAADAGSFNKAAEERYITPPAVIKQITGGTTPEDLEKIAKSMEDTLKNELRIKTVIGIGTVSDHLRELADSY